MPSCMRVLKSSGFFFLILLMGWNLLGVDAGKCQVSFTYTAPVIQKNGTIDSLSAFYSTLTNTGSVADSFDVDMIEKPPTPVEWWIRFCSSGICWDETVTQAPIPVSLEPGDSGEIILDLKPVTFGTGNVSMRITSRANPSLSDSITFTLIVRRGDANGDGKTTVSDAVYLINYLFKGGPAPIPLLAGDCNCDTQVTISDVVYLVNYLFKSGPAPCI